VLEIETTSLSHDTKLQKSQNVSKSAKQPAIFYTPCCVLGFSQLGVIFIKFHINEGKQASSFAIYGVA